MTLVLHDKVMSPGERPASAGWLLEIRNQPVTERFFEIRKREISNKSIHVHNDS